MIYLYWYLGIGAVISVVIVISHHLAKPPVDDHLNELLQATDPDRDRWWWKPLNNVVVPTLAAVMILGAWPIAIYLKVKEMFEALRNKDEEPPAELPVPEEPLQETQELGIENSRSAEFAIFREHLQKQQTETEIESAETVVDPLDAAPRTPFGHLNQAWETFKQSIQDGDQLWAFSAPWSSEWGCKEVRDGYVILRGETIGPHFLTRRVICAEDGGQGVD